VIDIDGAGNTLAGTGHVFDGSFVDSFCEVSMPLTQTGAIGFSATSDPGGPATCPPAFP